MFDSSEVVVGNVALSFARALVAGDFEAAQQFLDDVLRNEWTPLRLEETLRSMVDYGDGPPEQVQLVRFDDMHAWPTRQPTDIGWAYVAIFGDGFNEAVSVIVAIADGRGPRIRNVEWGRP